MSGGAELIGGPEKRSIVLVPHDPGWADAFVRHRTRVVGALGARAVRVDHIGSTSVPGLDAKPIVDVDLSVADPDDEGAYLEDLLRAGYELRVREPGHRLVRSPSLDAHIHVCAAGGPWERRHLLFREWLRRDRADREAYAALKHRLAGRDWPTMNHYAEAKGHLIAGITGRAEAWAQASGWTVDHIPGSARMEHDRWVDHVRGDR